MRVIHYLPSFRLELGGIVRAVVDMATLLAARGVEVTVMTHDETDRPAAWTNDDPATPQTINLGPLISRVRRLSAAQKRAARDHIRAHDVLHIHACWNPANNQLARLAKAAGVPYVQSVHGMLDDWSMAQSTFKKRVFLATGGARTLRGAAAVHCTAEAELDQARKWFSPTPGVVCPLVFDLRPFRELPGPELARSAFADHLTDDEPLVLFLARIHYKKGVDVFIRSIGELHRRGVACRAIVAGTAEMPGYMDEMRALARTEGVADRTGFVGHVSGPTKRSLYQLADVFSGPTSQENFGFVFPEALACGTPVITTRGVDIHPELTASGGAIIAERTPEAFADATADLLADEPRRLAMGASGRRWAFDRFDRDSVAAEYADLYARVSGLPADRPAPSGKDDQLPGEHAP